MTKTQMKQALQAHMGEQPFMKLMDLRLDKLLNNRALLSVACKPETLNVHGSLLGGVLSFAADVAMWVALASGGFEIKVVTTDLAIRYLDRFEKGRAVFDAQVIKNGRRMIMTECNVYNHKKVLAAHVTGSFLRID